MTNQVHYMRKLWTDHDDVISVPLTFSGLTGKELLGNMQNAGVIMETSIQNLFLSDEFVPSKEKSYTLSIMKGVIFDNLKVGIDYTREEAIQRQFETAGIEMVANLLLSLSSKQIMDMGFGCIIFMTERLMKPSEKIPYYLAIDCIGDVPEIISFYDDSSIITNKYDGYAYAEFPI